MIRIHSVTALLQLSAVCIATIICSLRFQELISNTNDLLVQGIYSRRDTTLSHQHQRLAGKGRKVT